MHQEQLNTGESASSREGTIRSILEPYTAILSPELTTEEAIAQLRSESSKGHFTYAYVTSNKGALIGVVVMRDLLFGDSKRKISDFMIKAPFSLTPDLGILECMKLVVARQFPEYPVCDENGVLLGSVRGTKIFENQAIEISAQAGSMVGVDKEERLSTHWGRSFRFRHPWLQLNLLTAFAAGAVVSIFQETIDQLVILAVFLPVLAGQSGNTGCQALAVTLRGLTLGDLSSGKERILVAKEALLGLLNGACVGVSAAIGMYILASMQNNPMALSLAGIVFAAMIGSCIVSGVSGALIPLILRRIGADPATASSIFLTTMTDIASMGLLLGLSTAVLL